jgi:hypothetical protein
MGSMVKILNSTSRQSNIVDEEKNNVEKYININLVVYCIKNYKIRFIKARLRIYEK